jgi:hypothetical protein
VVNSVRRDSGDSRHAYHCADGGHRRRCEQKTEDRIEYGRALPNTPAVFRSTRQPPGVSSTPCRTLHGNRSSLSGKFTTHPGVGVDTPRIDSVSSRSNSTYRYTTPEVEQHGHASLCAVEGRDGTPRRSERHHTAVLAGNSRNRLRGVTTLGGQRPVPLGQCIRYC